MARKGRIDRGLMQKRDVRGKIVWYVRLYNNGKEHRFGSFGTKTQAREFYETKKQEQKEGRFFPERYHLTGSASVQNVFDNYLLGITTKKDQRTERYMARWWGETLKGRRLNQITVDALDTARQGLLAKGCTPQRVNRYMAWLRHVLNGAIRAGKLSSNPVTKLKMFKEPKGKTRFLSFEEEYKKLYPELGTMYAPWARLAILTGLRQEEQFTLRWSQIDLERGLITLPTTKAGDCQYLPLNEEAITILRALDSWKYSAWVFPSENPATSIDPRNFLYPCMGPCREASRDRMGDMA